MNPPIVQTQLWYQPIALSHLRWKCFAKPINHEIIIQMQGTSVFQFALKMAARRRSGHLTRSFADRAMRYRELVRHYGVTVRDLVGAYPAERPVGPEHIAHTIYHAMGIHDLTAFDNQNRPYSLLDEGTAISALF